MTDLPKIPFQSQAGWEQWLEEHHTTSDGLWLQLFKKSSGVATVTYDQAVEAALCFGWIDGQKLSFDEKSWLQKFTPRRKGSKWSKINVAKVKALIEQGRMRPAGMAEIEKAQADGRWDAAYESQSKIAVPDDFQAALDQNPIAKEFYAKLNSANRYAILYRITTSKRPETRQKNIDKFIAMLNAGEKLY